MTDTASELAQLDAAWCAFADRVRAAGQSISGYTDDPRLLAEGYRYVGRLTNLAHQIYLEFANPLTPILFRYGDDVTPFGATNTDNNYARAMLEPTGTYRVTGDISGVKELLISIHDGEMALGKVAVLAEVSLSDLETIDGHLELMLGGLERAANWLPISRDSAYVNVRQFVADWEYDPIAVLTIERLDTTGAQTAITPKFVASALDRAATWVESSVAYWKSFSDDVQESMPTNSFSAPHRPAGGAVNMVHGAGCWNLKPDQALIVEFDEPDATYWSIQTYMWHWLQPLDFVNRVTSLNDHQTRTDSDGKVRIVLSGADPGVQNWLDTSGLQRGLCSYRWVRATTEPSPLATLVHVGDVRAHLHESTPLFNPAERAEQIRGRRRGVARRFRC